LLVRFPHIKGRYIQAPGRALGPTGGNARIRITDIPVTVLTDVGGCSVRAVLAVLAICAIRAVLAVRAILAVCTGRTLGPAGGNARISIADIPVTVLTDVGGCSILAVRAVCAVLTIRAVLAVCTVLTICTILAVGTVRTLWPTGGNARITIANIPVTVLTDVGGYAILAVLAVLTIRAVLAVGTGRTLWPTGGNTRIGITNPPISVIANVGGYSILTVLTIPTGGNARIGIANPPISVIANVWGYAVFSISSRWARRAGHWPCKKGTLPTFFVTQPLHKFIFLRRAKHACWKREVIESITIRRIVLLNIAFRQYAFSHKSTPL